MSGYSEAPSKFCGDKILWNNSSRYLDVDGEWHNRKLPVNFNGGEHCCERKREWASARLAAAMAVGL